MVASAWTVLAPSLANVLEPATTAPPARPRKRSLARTTQALPQHVPAGTALASVAMITAIMITTLMPSLAFPHPRPVRSAAAADVPCSTTIAVRPQASCTILLLIDTCHTRFMFVCAMLSMRLCARPPREQPMLERWNLYRPHWRLRMRVCGGLLWTDV